MENRKYHIAQFGTFDVESMGDSLFPSGLTFGLRKYIDCDVELFSMNECANPYNNNSHVYSFAQFQQRHAHAPFDLVVLGGGEFLHFHPIKFMVDGEEKPYAGGYLWKEPIRMASEMQIPVVVNCVGVPHDLSESQQEELREYLNRVSYIAVRDEYSAKRLQKAGINHVHCVADNLWYLNQLFPGTEVDTIRGELQSRTGRDYTAPYMVAQYGTTKNVEELSRQLKRIKKGTGCRIYLMAVNYCHEDSVGMEKLKNAGDGEFEVISDYLQPAEMIAVISGAKAFFGTSLHGNLIAASYGVPFVGIDMYPAFVSKMDGIFGMIGCEQYLAPGEDAVKAAYDARRRDSGAEERIAADIADIQMKLDRHFACICQILKGEH